jgi:hypothetical protein
LAVFGVRLTAEVCAPDSAIAVKYKKTIPEALIDHQPSIGARATAAAA